MIKKFFLVLFAAVSFAPQARALDFDGTTGGFNLEKSLPSLELPVARPAPATETKTAGCRPFLMSVSVGGVNEAVVIERACTPENEAVWVLLIENKADRKIEARVVSDKYPAEKALIEKRIKAMLLDGMTKADADVVVGKVGPLLTQAAAAGTQGEKDALTASAAELLKNYLARP